MKKLALFAALALCLSLCLPACAEPLPGGWTVPDSAAMTAEEKAVFDKAMEGLTGVMYEPALCLGTQAVAGTNYCFLCKATAVYPGAAPEWKLVYIFLGLDGTAEITQIAELDLARFSIGHKTVEPLPVKTSPESLAGQTVNAIPGAYDPETNTLALTLIEPEIFAAADIRSLEPGDIIVSGGREYPVETLTNDGYYWIVNSGEYEFSDDSLWLAPDADGNFRPTAYDDYTWRTACEITLSVPEDLVFLDGINPLTGEIRQEPQAHTAAQFLLIKEAEEAEPAYNGPGFFGSNFTVTFDENGRWTTAERFYVPWQ